MKEDFVKEMGVLYTLQGEVNPQILSMILMAIAGEELSDEQKKWLDSNLVPFIGGYANKVEKEQGGEEVKESMITDESKKIGSALLYKIAFAVATNERVGSITFVSFFTPTTFKAICNAEVPEFVATTYLQLVYLLIFFSKIKTA